MTRCRFKSYWKDDSQYKDWIASREQKERGRRKRRGEKMKEEKKRVDDRGKGRRVGREDRSVRGARMGAESFRGLYIIT